jgi:hypothetical protein
VQYTVPSSTIRPVRTGHREIIRPLPGIIRSSGAIRFFQTSAPLSPDRQ